MTLQSIDYAALLDAVNRELAKRRTAYPRISEKKKKQGATEEELIDLATTQRIQFELLENVQTAMAENFTNGVDANMHAAMLSELKRELQMRKKSYPRWVYLKRMKPEVAESELAVWVALVKHFESEVVEFFLT